MKLKVKCPAKINLTLKVFKKDEITGFHPIESVMQTVSLYDYLTVEANGCNIEFTGTSGEILYDENNLVIKACQMFFKYAGMENAGLKIHLEKNIPVAAGLAGGSTDASGMIFALNHIFKDAISADDIFKINSILGSDLNFCYKGGKALCKGKGDDITPLEFKNFPLTIVKPKNLKISTKSAYQAFDLLKENSNLPNDLEFALLPAYPELQKLHGMGLQMSGSGPSFFIEKEKLPFDLPACDYEIFENLKAVSSGVEFI